MHLIPVGLGNSILQNHAVLPRDASLVLTGKSRPGSGVRVELGAAHFEAEASPDGRWEIELPPSGPAVEIEIAVRTVERSWRFCDLCFGDLWLCSGQSNMEMAVAAATGGVETAERATDRFIREFRVAKEVGFDPRSTVSGEWHPCLGDEAKSASAVGFFFARRLRAALDVPVGIVKSCWSATSIASWISRETLRAQSGASHDYERWWRDAKAVENLPERFPALHRQWLEELTRYRLEVEGPYAEAFEAAKASGRVPPPLPPPAPEGIGSRSAPGVIHNAMIAPLAGIPFKGVLWYQGESDTWFASDDLKHRPCNYETLLRALIGEWRSVLGSADLPFFIVQLANFDACRKNPPDTGWARVREAQQRVTDLPSVFVTPAIDLGESHNIHPPDKRPLGERLANLALQHLHGAATGAEAPRVAGFSIGKSTIVIRPSCELRPLEGTVNAGFVGASMDRCFVPLEAKVERDQIIVTAASDRPIAAVRYAWEDDPICPVFGTNGLPLLPFRSDQWEE